MTATIQATGHRWYTVHHPAERAYAAMCAVLLVGMAGIAAPGVPSAHFGFLVVGAAMVAFVVGGLYEQSAQTVIGGLVGGAVGNYVVDTAANHRTYSHWTLGAQLAVLTAGMLATGRALNSRRQAAGDFQR